MNCILWISVTLPSTDEIVNLTVEYNPGVSEPASVTILSGVDQKGLTHEDWEEIMQEATIAYDAEGTHCWDDDEPGVDESMYDPYMGQDFDSDFYDLD